jgi:diaminopimelate epimerase
VNISDIENFDLIPFGRFVRYHEIFAPAGTNVNIYERLDNGKIRMRTYERGVEDETMACGTGAVAVSIFAVKDKIVESPVTIVASSGIELKVYLEDDKCYLEGEARVIYKGELLEDAYKY